MLRHSELPLPIDVPAFDAYEDDPALYDASPGSIAPDLVRALHTVDGDEDGIGLRALLETPEALATAWRSARERPRRRAVRASAATHRKTKEVHHAPSA